MTDDRSIEITPELTISAGELRFQFARSGGPGGQHVNTSATSVELLFDVANSPSLSEEQRARVLSALKSYIDGRGILHLVASGSRSQSQNRAEVVARFQRLMRRALHVPRKRLPTRPGAVAKERRLRAKRRRSETKLRRRPPHLED